ncbi:hypothetical protein [Streptomyces sp. NPDC005930]|uniref:hypothetical protein n=1 Tax=Streptomyces sp. NPDC005930 TaxID=3364736 RepID=UPI0036B39975
MRRRPAAVLTVLLTLLLLVQARPGADARAGDHAGYAGALAVAGATAVPHPAPDLHVDDGCAPDCAVQPRARHDQPAERPAAPDQPAAAPARGAGLVPAARTRAPAGSGPVPASPGRTSHDSGRAPPVSSGIRDTAHP